MLLVDLNYNYEFDWFVELSDNKLSDNNLASKLVGNRSFFKPITIEEIVIFMIRYVRGLKYKTKQNLSVNHVRKKLMTRRSSSSIPPRLTNSCLKFLCLKPYSECQGFLFISAKQRGTRCETSRPPK